MQWIRYFCNLQALSKIKIIEDIQWFDVKYGIYFTSKKYLKILPYSWKKFYIQEKALNFLFITISFVLHSFYFCLILDTECNTWRDACYIHNVKITACEDITFIQWIKSGIYDWTWNKIVYMLFELVTCLFYRAFLVLILLKIVKIIFQ